MCMYTLHCKSKKSKTCKSCIYSLQDDSEVSAASATPLSREGTICICIYFLCVSLCITVCRDLIE